ncbi:MAG TPA: DUF2786 domain-containing protein [Chlamydiales bacterium]|nr:DUF2786 domain-containing protein [Chlamydiales bacterium]
MEIKKIIKHILANEVRLKVAGNRFYYKQHSYPIHIAIYHGRAVLGYFDSSFYELGFNECLMKVRHEQLENVIRHELAHYLTFIEKGHVLHTHGSEFKECCQRLNWGEEVSKASICLESRDGLKQEKSAIYRKIQKLMALGSTSSKNEAEQAITKSQQLLLKHNIEPKYLENDEEVFFLIRVMKQKKKTAKMCAIGRILETFFVSIVYHRASDGTYLEILGEKVNVEIAEYVANVLDLELENLWEQARQNGLIKNSFLLGIAKGYCNKIEELKKGHSKEITNALVRVEKKLMDAKAMAYLNLSYSKSAAKYCSKSFAFGEQMGKKLNINPALQKSSDLRLLN